MTDRLPTHEVNTTLIRLNYGAEEGHRSSTQAALSVLCDVVDEYRALVEALYAVVPNGWRYTLTEDQQALFEAVHDAAFVAEQEGGR